MDYILPNKQSFTMASSNIVWWSIILIPPSFWIFQLLNVSVILYVVGAVASAAFSKILEALQERYKKETSPLIIEMGIKYQS